MKLIPDKFAYKALICVVMFIVVLIGVTYAVYVIFEKSNEDPNMYASLATALVINWMIVLVSYYIWAIQFYTVNFGWSISAWERHAAAPEKDEKKKEPEANPNHGESLGLPEGTIRGTIAVTLLVGALAMMIASLGMDSRLNQNEFFVDNFEFFKTAFLMMIAFYFGNKSLEFLKDRKQVYGTGSATNPATASRPATPPVLNSSAQIDANAAKAALNETDLDSNDPDFESADAQG